MKAIEMTKLLELVTTEVTKDFTDRNGELKDVEILALRKVAKQPRNKTTSGRRSYGLH